MIFFKYIFVLTILVLLDIRLYTYHILVFVVVLNQLDCCYEDSLVLRKIGFFPDLYISHKPEIVLELVPLTQLSLSLLVSLELL